MFCTFRFSLSIFQKLSFTTELFSQRTEHTTYVSVLEQRKIPNGQVRKALVVHTVTTVGRR